MQELFSNSDAASPFDVANFVMFKKDKSICHGTYGVAKGAVRGDLPESSATGMQEQQAHQLDTATKLATTMNSLIEVFRCEGRNDAVGEVGSLRNQILEIIIHQVKGGGLEYSLYYDSDRWTADLVLGLTTIEL